MKKFFLLILMITVYCLSFSQNVGIGTNNPNRARLVVNGSVGNTTAIFGGETTGISFQSNFPTIGFNEYYNNGHRYIAAGFAAHQFFDPALGYMAFDIFPQNTANATATSSNRILVFTSTGDVIVGTGNARVGINMNPAPDGAHNAALQIRQSVESNNAGITLSDFSNNTTWKISSLNVEGGILALNLNSNGAGFFASTGDYISFSDRRLKNDVQDLPSVMDKVMQLQPVQYKMKHNNHSNRVSIGFIAQDIKTAFPGLVYEIPGSDSDKNSDKLLAVSYSGFGVLAIKAIQEQQKMIEKLQARLAEIELRISSGLTAQ